MPWKLLFFIIVMALMLVFVGFNLGNTSDVSLVFYTFLQVPIVITMLIAFIAGLLVAFFFTVSKALFDTKNGRRKTALAKQPSRQTRKSSVQPVDPEATTYLPGPIAAPEAQSAPKPSATRRRKSGGEAAT